MKIKINEKTYTPKELKGQDLFLFMGLADKLDIKLTEINKAAGDIKIPTLEEFQKDKNLMDDVVAEKYLKFLQEQQGAALGLGITTYIFKKAHKAKDEINELIATTWEMDLSLVKDLNIQTYAKALKGAFQFKSLTEAFKLFFQLENQK